MRSFEETEDGRKSSCRQRREMGILGTSTMDTDVLVSLLDETMGHHFKPSCPMPAPRGTPM